MPPIHPVAITCIATLGLLLFGLGLGVSALRGKYNIGVGHPTDPTHLLYRTVRAHGNTAEYAPFMAVLFLYLGGHSHAPWVYWVMAAATLSRVLFVAGLLTYPTLARPSPLRFVGSAGTYASGIALSIAVATGA